jgi:hypothetical protein
MTPLGIEPVTFQFVARCLDQPRRRKPDESLSTDNKFQLLGVIFNIVYILPQKDVYRKRYNYFH